MDNFEARELYNQSRIFLSQKKYEEALEYINEAISLDKTNKDFFIQKGVILANTGKFSEAAKNMENAVKIDKKCGEAYFHLGNLYELQGIKSASVKNYNKAIASGYNNPQLFYHMGLMYESNDNLEMALRFFSKVVQMDAMRSDARIRKIRLLIRNGYFPEALDEANELILIEPDLYDGHHLKASVLTSMGKYDESITVLDKAIKAFPNETKFKLDKVSVLSLQKRRAEAEKLVDELVNDNTMSATDKRFLEIERARIYAEDQKIDEMIEALKKAREYSKVNDPNDIDPEATFLLTSILITKNDYDAVITYSEELVGCKKMTYAIPAYYYKPVAVMRRDGAEAAKPLYKEAIVKLRKITMENPQLSDGYFFRALCHKDIKEYDKAMKLCDYLIKTDDKNPSYQSLKKELLSLMKNAGTEPTGETKE